MICAIEHILYTFLTLPFLTLAYVFSKSSGNGLHLTSFLQVRVVKVTWYRDNIIKDVTVDGPAALKTTANALR